MDKEYIEREAVIKGVRLLPRLAPYNSVLYSSVQRTIFNAPTADVVEVEKVEKAREEIISRMSELMSEYMKHGSGADYYAGKSESMETAIRVVREMFNNLLVSGGVGDAVELAEGENKTDFLFSRRNKNE